MQEKINNPVRISFFGIGCRILVGAFNEKKWLELSRVAKKMNSELTSAIFDPSFYFYLDDPEIRSLTDFGNVHNLWGLCNSYKSVIEIQVYRKRRRKVKYNEILKPSTLFPIYNTKEHNISSELNERTLVIVEKEIGQISRFLVNPNSFSIEKLLFEISNLNIIDNQGFDLLTNLYYEDMLLSSFNGNSLICEQYALMKK